jgi:hypothetical protein
MYYAMTKNSNRVTKSEIVNVERSAPAPRSGKKLPRPGYGDVRDKLSDRQWLYVLSYATHLDHTRAMKEAGYSPNTRFPNTQEVRDAIQLELMESEVGLGILPGAQLKRYMQIAERCMQAVPASEWRFDAANAIRALENVSKATKLYTDKISVSVDQLGELIEQIQRESQGVKGYIKS